jgi:hypothetical protein
LKTSKVYIPSIALNHVNAFSLLDSLEEDLLLELDEVVRANQLVCLPLAKSGRMELLLHERNPGLAQEIDEERQRKIRDMTFRSNLKEEDNRFSSLFHIRVGSLDDVLSSSPSQDKLSRKLKTSRNAPFSPFIRPKDFSADLMFDMDEEDSESLGNSAPPVQRPIDWANESLAKATPTDLNGAWHNSKGKAKSSLALSPKKENGSLPTTMPWSLPVLSSERVDMRDIMAQASMGRTSSLSLGLSAEKVKEDTAMKTVTPKISQKEKKKQKQQALQQVTSQPQLTMDKTLSNIKISSPWQLPNARAKMPLKDVIESESNSPALAKSPQPSNSPIPPLDLSHRCTAPDARFAGQLRSSDSNASMSKTKITPNSPHFKTYATPARNVEPSLQLTMADIIGQQKREQELIKEAAAKRSLQEIQEEQAFQEWWDRESRKAQEEEALKHAGGASSGGVESGRAKGKGNKRGARTRSPRGREDGAHSGSGSRRRGRGRGRGKGQDAITD